MSFNKTFLITRPRQQAQTLIKAIEDTGSHCISFPCLEIETIKRKKVAPVAQQDICIFTSANAVNGLTNSEQSQLPKIVIAVGPASSIALEQRGVKNILVPEQYSTHGILDLKPLQHISQKHIMIFTGENPKPLLTETLSRRHAIVSSIYCYRRVKPQYNNDDIQKIVHTTINYIITLNTETLLNLCDIFKAHHDWLTSHNLIVASPSAEHTAKAAGFTKISLAKDPTPTSIIHSYL